MHFVLDVAYKSIISSKLSALFPEYFSPSFEALKCWSLIHGGCTDQAPSVSALYLTLGMQPEFKKPEVLLSCVVSSVGERNMKSCAN